MSTDNYRVSPINAFNDNYIWLITVPDSNQCIVVDPGDADVVLDVLAQRQLELTAIFVTHHHHDHVGGVAKLAAQAAKSKQFTVFGPSSEAQSLVNVGLSEGDIVDIATMNLQFKVLDLPGHTLGHIAFYDRDSLFCGDTLFAGGCGRMFEGTPAQMHNSLSKLAALPPATNIYCAHEYTLANLDFAKTVEPENETVAARIAFCRQQRALSIPTVPSTVEQELATNPFLRTDESDVISMIASRLSTTKTLTEVDVFANLRQWKDNF